MELHMERRGERSGRGEGGEVSCGTAPPYHGKIATVRLKSTWERGRVGQLVWAGNGRSSTDNSLLKPISTCGVQLADTFMCLRRSLS